MKTPWGEIAVSDAHVHFFSRGFFEILADRKALRSTMSWPASGWMHQTPTAMLARRWVQELDQHGVQSTRPDRQRSR